MRKKQAGFSLLELLVVLGVVAILMTIAAPAMRGWLPHFRLTSAARDLFSNMQKAKITAIKHNRNCAITFNQAVDGRVFDYVVYVDPNNNLEFDPNAGTDGADNDGDGVTDEADETEMVIASVSLNNYKGVLYDPAQGGGDGLDFTNNDDGLPTIAFRSNGLPINNGGGLGSGTVFLKNINERALRIIVSRAGNVRIDE